MVKSGTTQTKQGFELHIDMGTVNGRRVGVGRDAFGIGGMIFQSMGSMGKDFCPNFLQPFHETIDRRSCKDGS